MDNSSENNDLCNKSLIDLRAVLKKEFVDFWAIPISHMRRTEVIQKIKIMRKLRLIEKEIPEETTLVTCLPPRDIPIVPVIEDGLEMEIPTAPTLRKKKASLKEIARNEKIIKTRGQV